MSEPINTATQELVMAAGSVSGREHRRLSRNGQDAVAVAWSDDIAICAVADGCSAGAGSEVGARLATSWAVRHMPEQLRSLLPAAQRGVLDPDDLAPVFKGLLACFESLLDHLATGGQDRARVVHELLLCTLHIVVVSPEAVLAFGVGDGVLLRTEQLDEGLVIHREELDAGPGNAPDYVAYRLLPSLPHQPVTRIHYQGPRESFDSFLMASDGASELEGLESLVREPRYRRNLSLVHKHLVAAVGRPGGPRDDTSVVMVANHSGGTRCV